MFVVFDYGVKLKVVLIQTKLFYNYFKNLFTAFSTIGLA
jgi:hypothetical protein